MPSSKTATIEVDNPMNHKSVDSGAFEDERTVSQSFEDENARSTDPGAFEDKSTLPQSFEDENVKLSSFESEAMPGSTDSWGELAAGQAMYEGDIDTAILVRLPQVFICATALPHMCRKRRKNTI